MNLKLLEEFLVDKCLGRRTCNQYSLDVSISLTSTQRMSLVGNQKSARIHFSLHLSDLKAHHSSSQQMTQKRLWKQGFLTMKCEAMLNAFFFKQSQPLEKYHSMEKHMDFDLPEANEEKLRLWSLNLVIQTHF